jgi:hypothetical protein
VPVQRVCKQRNEVAMAMHGRARMGTNGHEWEAKPMHIRRGKWCPTCSRKWRMITMAQIHAMAQARGGACLSTHYGNDNQKLRWRCAHGHEWLAIPSKIKSGSWCRECSQPSYTIADMRDLAQRQTGECVSQEYVIGSPGKNHMP